MGLAWSASIPWSASGVNWSGILGVLFALDIDWPNDGTWTDIAADVLSFATRTGREPAQEVAARAIAGRLTAALKNNSGNYSPENSGGAYYGNILPGRPVRLRCVSPYADTVWQGVLRDIEPAAMPRAFPTATLTADGPQIALDTEVSVAMQTNVATGAAIAEVLDKANFSATLRDLDTGQTTMTRWWRGPVKARTAAREVEATEGGFLRETRDGKIAFEDRYHRFDATHQTVQATYSDDPGTAGANRYIEIERPSPLPRVFNDVRAPVTTYTVEALTTLWTHPLANETGDAPSIPPGESLSFFADAQTLAAARTLVGVAAWTTPTLGNGSDIEVWSVNDGTGTDLGAADISIAVSALGTTLKITLTNDHATLTGYVTAAQARGTAVTASDPVWVQAEDSTSQNAYGLRRFPRDAEAPFIPDTAEAQGSCDWRLQVWKDALPSLRIRIAALKDRAHTIEAITRDVSDRVTVEATQARTQFGLSGDYYVEGVAHRFNRDHSYTVDLLLADATQWSDAWVWGSAKWGSTTRWFY